LYPTPVYEFTYRVEDATNSNQPIYEFIIFDPETRSFYVNAGGEPGIYLIRIIATLNDEA